jgi:hypothetical protein
MNTVTAAPVSPLARLKAKLPPLPPPTPADRARWRRIAADRSRVVVTDEAPDVSRPTPGLIECAPPESFPIDDRTAAWFSAHGGHRAVKRALRAYMREHRTSAVQRRRDAPARRSSVSR